MPTEAWRVGDVTITKVVESEILGSRSSMLGEILPSSTRAEIEAMQSLRATVCP